MGHPPLRLPRPLGAVGRRAGARAATRRLPSRRRLLGDRGARRPLGRHDDGLQPARGRADGDALRVDRRRDRAPPAAHGQARRSRRSSRRSSPSPGLLGLSGETARVEELERSGSPAAELALARLRPSGRGALSRRWRRRSTGSTRSSSRPGSARARRASARDVCERLGFLGVELDVEANATAVPDADVNVPGSAVRIVVLHAREDVVAARAARELAQLAPSSRFASSSICSSRV